MEEVRKLLEELYIEFGRNEVTVKASQYLDKLILKEQLKYEKR